jgi:hypothetical protein
LKSVLPGILSCKVAGSLVTMKKQCRIFRHKSFTRNTERIERKFPFGSFTSPQIEGPDRDLCGCLGSGSSPKYNYQFDAEGLQTSERCCFH